MRELDGVGISRLGSEGFGQRLLHPDYPPHATSSRYALPSLETSLTVYYTHTSAVPRRLHLVLPSHFRASVMSASVENQSEPFASLLSFSLQDDFIDDQHEIQARGAFRYPRRPLVAQWPFETLRLNTDVDIREHLDPRRTSWNAVSWPVVLSGTRCRGVLRCRRTLVDQPYTMHQPLQYIDLASVAGSPSSFASVGRPPTSKIHCASFVRPANRQPSSNAGPSPNLPCSAGLRNAAIGGRGVVIVRGGSRASLLENFPLCNRRFHTADRHALASCGRSRDIERHCQPQPETVNQSDTNLRSSPADGAFLPSSPLA
ncbi:hypothetical protein C8F01DRAFT_1280950 [Mycena amicta]|nr:hypothetical protein C8F01DRAFT_1280950 [Mycena amicta]